MSISRWQTFFLLPWIVVPVIAAEIPHAEIPRLTHTAPTIDGEISPAEWSGAATIRQIRPLGSNDAANVDTEYRLFFDDEALYVAARCLEDASGVPEAYSRPWHDLFFNNDDAVQVVLGVADPEIAVRDKINVGGYEGALDGDVAAADFYYLFTVNAVNARQRQFNEAPLETAGFDSAISVQPGREWVAEMRIPLAACGLTAPDGKTVYANLFRYRPPEMLGWHLPSYGGYAAMPFGTFSFGSQATEETFPDRRQKTAKQAPSCRAELKYGPLNGAIVGVVKVTGKQPELTGTLEVTGMDPIRQILKFDNALDRDRNPLAERQALVICEFPPGTQPERTAHFTVRDPQNRIVAETELKCPAAIAPEWLGTDAGKEYVDKKVPAPWTPPALVDNTVRLSDKTLEFAPNALFSAVHRDGARDALFSDPPRIVISRHGRELEFSGTPAGLAVDGTQVRISGRLQAADGTALEARGKVDFDGFLEYKFELTGRDLAGIDRVEVVLPLAPGMAKYLLPGTSVQKAGALTGAGYRGPASQLWIGNEEEGLSFSYDTDPFRSRDRRHQLEVRQTETGDSVVIRLVDGAGQLSGSRALFRFFLQPTPTKPYPARPVQSVATWWWEGWSGWHGYPDLGKVDVLKTRVGEESGKGRLLTLYCCQGLQEDAPEMKQFRADLELDPEWRYYFWQGKNCYATCKRGPEGDLQLHNYRKLIAETGIRGIMSDGLSVPWGDANVLHRFGCGRPTEVSLEKDTPSLVVKQREFLKRMRGLFDATGDEFCLVAHTGGGIDVNTLSFFDAYFEGEQLMRFRRGYYPSEAMYAVAYSGMPWGWRTIYWPKQLHNYDGLDTALAYCLLFNSEYAVNHDTEPEAIDVKLLTRFGGPGSEFHPFWRNQERIGFTSERCVASLYYRDTESLVVIGNLGYTAGDYTLDLNKLYPGCKIEVTDALRDVPVEGPVVTGSIAPHSCRLLIVKPATTAATAEPEAVADRGSGPAAAFTVEGFDSTRWKLVNAASGSLDGGKLVLTASPERGAATAEFSETFGRDLTVEMMVKLPTRFRFALGNAQLTYGGGWPGWGWMVQGTADPYGRGWIFMGVPLVSGEYKPLNINLKNGVLDVWYDHHRVVRNLALKMPESGNAFAITTWYDDTIAAESIRLSTQAEEVDSVPVHPIMEVTR